MLTITEILPLREVLAQWRLQGERISFVPTMGNLHAGHLCLVKQARASTSKVIVSIFVNPIQFDRADDLAAYPRTLAQDHRKLSEIDADILFAPGVEEIYPYGIENTTRVEVPSLSYILCGASRPGHFRGVATVVTKLFNMVQPDVAVFGEKDYQQLLLIRRLVADLSMPVEITAVPTQRESDGLAMSSRNRYLDPLERKKAPILYRTLQDMAEAVHIGERDYRKLEQQASQRLAISGLRPDYISICRQHDLATAEIGDDALVILAAAWLGKARLIDNIPIRLIP